MQFFYIDYMNGDRKERNVGFLRVERSGVCVGLRGVPAQCGTRCSVYAVGDDGQRWCMGEIALKDGYGMEKLNWGESRGFEKCVRVEVPFYKNRKGVCVLREAVPQKNAFQESQEHVFQEHVIDNEPYQEKGYEVKSEKVTHVSEIEPVSISKSESERFEEKTDTDLPDKLPQDKWEQLADTYPHVHIFPEAQSLLIKPKDLVVLTQRYHSLISNSFVLHSYYNYRQLLLFRFEKRPLPENELQAADTGAVYYLGVPGVYYDREKRIAQMFGFEGFDIGEARMCEESKREVYEGCFGYYMKQVEI